MLEVITLDDARKIVSGLECLSGQGVSIGLNDAPGTVTACDIISQTDVPSFNRSLVDGFAVLSSDTFGCSESLPAILSLAGEICMGEDVQRTILPGQCMRIPTGGKLPQGADCAVMLEYTEEPGDGSICVLRACAPQENIMPAGADVRCNDCLISAGHMLGAKDTAVLAAAGVTQVEVIKKPVVAVISTGDELVSAGSEPKGSQVRDINTPMLCACVKECGCEALCMPIVKDEPGELYNALNSTLGRCDAVLVSGGSSVGERDALYSTLEQLGKVLFHGIAVKPGKPTMLAVAGGKPVFGLPGHPLAAFFMFKELASPLLCRMARIKEKTELVTARAVRNIPSNHGREELIPVTLDSGSFEPLVSKSGAVSVLARAQGYIKIPRGSEGIFKDEEVQVRLF